MNIDRSRHNVYKTNKDWNAEISATDSITSTSGQTTTSGSGSTIIISGGGSGLTSEQLKKLNSIEEGAQVNQDAFSYIKLNDGAKDTLIEAAKTQDRADINFKGIGVNVDIESTEKLDATDVASTGTNKGVYSFKYDVHQASIEGESPKWLLEIVYKNGDRIKPSDITNIYLINDTTVVYNKPLTDSSITYTVNENSELETITIQKDGLYFKQVQFVNENTGQSQYQVVCQFKVAIRRTPTITIQSANEFWKLDENGNLYTTYNTYSTKELSAYGLGPGEAPTGAWYLHELKDVDTTDIQDQGLLQYNLSIGKWVVTDGSSIRPDLTGYATEQWVNNTLGSYATKTYVSSEISKLVDSAPETLDTLYELAAALGNDPNFSTTVLNLIGTNTQNIETNRINIASNVNEINNLKYITSIFQDMFEWDKSESTTDSTKWKIKAKATFYSVGEVSAYGVGEGQEPTGAQCLYELKDVNGGSNTLPTSADTLLMWNGTTWEYVSKDQVGLNTTELEQYLTNNSYAKKSEIPVVPDIDTYDKRYVLKSGDTMTGDLNVNGYLFGGNETFLARPEYAFFGKDYGIYFYYLIGNTLSVNTHNNRLYQAHSFDIYIDSGVVNFQNGIYINNAAPGITLMRTEGAPYIRFANSNDSFCGEIGVSSDGRLIFWPAVSSAPGYNKWNTVLHGGNYASIIDSRYVLKSGDTMTGDLAFSAGKGIASSTGTLEVGRYSGTIYLQGNSLYYSPSNGTNYTVWHAGNDGSGSGLDADMLDGLHYTSFARKDAWQANNLNDINDTGIMTNYANADATVERNYPIQEAGILIYGTAAYNSSNQIYGTFSSNRWFARGGGISAQNKTSWREFAFTDSNVYSATRLQTPRTIWGQSFDGTSNISGWLTGATTIECSTGVRCRTICIETESDGTAGSRGSEINNFSNNLYLQHATSYGVIMCNGGGNVGIGTVSPGYKLHVNGDILANGYIHSVNNGVSSTFGAQNSSYCHISTNAAAFWFSSELRINGSILPYDGSHWIGTEDSPWGYVFSNGWFRSLGNTGWYNQTYSGGIYMTDSTYVRVYNGKRFYTSSSYYDAISTEGGFTCYANRSYSWGNGFGTINQSIPNDTGQTPLIVAYRNGSSGATNGSNRLFSVECLNSGMEVDLLFGGDIQFQFSNSGNFLAKGEVTAFSTSDIRLKTNFKELRAIECLRNLTTYEYDWTDEALQLKADKTKHGYGLIAQEVQKYIPEVVTNNMFSKGYLGIDYTKLVPFAISAIKEVDNEVTILKKRVKYLEDKLKQVYNQ